MAEIQSPISGGLKCEMSGIKNLDDALTLEIRRAESLRQAILKQAFLGTLAPQAPNAESATALKEELNPRSPAASVLL